MVSYSWSLIQWRIIPAYKKNVVMCNLYFPNLKQNINIHLQPRKKKPFIDKKNSVTFQLVHRSQKDPLAADETAPQHVLLEAQPLNQNKVR